ncbi:MAG: YfhO family protein [Chloroflexi bacterium]|nr:YfhO family protein [Chloroflexota bacterium]
MSWPVPKYFSQQLIGNNVDTWIFYWNNWWVKYALSHEQNIFDTQMMFYPDGSSLVAHSHSILNSLLAYPIDLIAGPIVAYNLVILLGLWLSAVGMFLFVHQLTGSKAAAFLSGLMFAFAPYHLTQALAHNNLSSIQWWPFYALMLHQLLQKQQWRYAFGTAVFASFTVYSGVQLGLLLILWTILYLGWHIKKARGAWRYLVGVTAVSLLFCLPILIPLLTNWDTVQTAQTNFDESSLKQTDLLAYWVPSVNHPLWGDLSRPAYERFVVNQAYMPYIGYAVLLLIGIAVWKRWHASRFWLMTALIWLLLASGSVLRFNGQLYDQIPLPYAWIGNMFPISLVRSPDRFNLLLVFATAVLTGIGASFIVQHKRWILWPIGAVLLAEFWLYPLPMWELPPSSPYFDTLAAESEHGIIDYPMGFTNSKFWLYYQTLHQQPIVEGHVSRFNAQTYATIFDDPLLQRLYAQAELPANVSLERPLPTTPLPGITPAIRNLQTNNISTVVVHTPYVSESELAYLHAHLPLIPVYQDEAVTIYDFNQPRPWQFGKSPIPLTHSVTLIEIEVLFDQASQTISLYLLTQLTDTSKVLDCVLGVGGGETAVSPSITFDNGQVGDLFQGWETAVLPKQLPTGIHPLHLRCNDGDKIGLPDSLVVDDNGNHHLTHQMTDINYQDEITLRGYRWWTRGSTLQINLTWHSQVENPGDYKEFIHLIDESGTIVRQYDAVPCQWACPTPQWQQNTLIHDSATLDLWGLPAGQYRLALGLYEPQTGTRLTTQQDGTAVPNNYFIISEFLEMAPTN